MVFADPAQSIYPNGFRWAQSEFRPRGAQVRTPPRPLPLDAADPRPRRLTLRQRRGDAARGRRAAREPPRRPLPVLAEFRSADEELEFVAKTIRAELADGRRTWQIGVLTSTNARRDEARDRLAAEGLPRPHAGSRRAGRGPASPSRPSTRRRVSTSPRSTCSMSTLGTPPPTRSAPSSTSRSRVRAGRSPSSAARRRARRCSATSIPRATSGGARRERGAGARAALRGESTGTRTAGCASTSRSRRCAGCWTRRASAAW